MGSRITKKNFGFPKTFWKGFGPRQRGPVRVLEHTCYTANSVYEYGIRSIQLANVDCDK